MAKIQRMKDRAARDLFSVSLDLDIIEFKINNIIEDLEEEKTETIEERGQLKNLKERARALRKLCESVRIGWEHEKQIQKM